MGEIILDYSGRAVVLTEILIRQVQEGRDKGENDVSTEAEINVARSQGMPARQGADSPWKSPEGTSSEDTLILVLLESFLTFDIQNCKRTNVVSSH